MKWGRKPQHTVQNAASGAAHASGAVLLAGGVLCLLFFLRAAADRRELQAMPPTAACAAVAALEAEAPVLFTVLGLSDGEAAAIPVAADRAEEQYRAFLRERRTFGDCFRDALAAFLGIPRKTA